MTGGGRVEEGGGVLAVGLEGQDAQRQAHRARALHGLPQRVEPAADDLAQLRARRQGQQGPARRVQVAGQLRAEHLGVAVVPAAIGALAVDDDPDGLLQALRRAAGPPQAQQGEGRRLDPGRRALHPGPARQGRVEALQPLDGVAVEGQQRAQGRLAEGRVPAPGQGGQQEGGPAEVLRGQPLPVQPLRLRAGGGDEHAGLRSRRPTRLVGPAASGKPAAAQEGPRPLQHRAHRLSVAAARSSTGRSFSAVSSRWARARSSRG